MEEYKDKKIKIIVESSTCEIYKPGDTIYIDRFLLDKERSDAVCLTAISAIYPFIYAARKGVTIEQMGYSKMSFQCPDCDESAVFNLVAYHDEDELE